MNGKSYLLAALALCGLGTLSGCTAAGLESWTYPSMKDVKHLASLESKEHAIHDANMTKQHQAMSPEAAEEIARIKADSDAKIAKIIEDRDKYRGTIATALDEAKKKAFEMALEMAGIPSTVIDKLQPEIDVAQDEADAAMNAFTLVGARADTVATAVDDAMEELDEIQMALAALSKETREKFADVSEETFDKLTALREDDEEFRRVLKQELQLSDAEMAALKDMTPDQILALLAAAGVAAVGGGALGKTGKSRGQADIDAMKDELSELKGRVS